MSTVNDNIKNATQCVIDWVLGKGYTNVSCAESIADSRISLHPGADCIGTLTASDLTSINNSITSLNTCTANLNTCTASLGTAVNNLCSCPGLQCTGTSTATFSLSGTTLTIIN